MNMKKTAIAGVAALSLLMVGCSSGGSDSGEGGHEPVTIRAVLPLPTDYPEMQGFQEDFAAALEETAPWVTLDVVGGPEVIPEVDQAEAVSNGAYDMTMLATAYSEGFIPGISSGMLTPNSPTEDREAGTIELYNELFFEPHGMTYLAAQQQNIESGIYLGTEQCEAFDPENPSLKGSVIRGGSQYIEAVEYLGGSIVSMPVGEIYNALERGVIDGFGGTAMGLPYWGVEEITGCLLNPEFKVIPFLQTVNTAWWDSLDEETRAGIEEAAEIAEGASEERYAQIDEEAYEWLADAGIETVEMSPEAGEKFREEVYDRSWENMIAANADVERLREHWEG